MRVVENPPLRVFSFYASNIWRNVLCIATARIVEIADNLSNSPMNSIDYEIMFCVCANFKIFAWFVKILRGDCVFSPFSWIRETNFLCLLSSDLFTTRLPLPIDEREIKKKNYRFGIKDIFLIDRHTHTHFRSHFIHLNNFHSLDLW